MSNTQHNDGGPAFPHPEFVIDVTLEDGRRAARVYDANPGMSLRDWFAGQALAGLLANPNYGAPTPKQDASQAYQSADAMLKAREAHA